MRKQPVMDELQKLQIYIKRFCPEIPDVKFSNTRYRNITEEEQQELLEKYLHNIRQLAAEDNQIN